MRIAANIFAGLVCILWGSLLWIGFGLMASVSSRHIPGYPNSGQIFFYIGVPGAVTAILVLAIFTLNSIFRSPTWLAFLAAAALLLLLYYFMQYTGGV